jgi:flavodoxin
MKILIIYDSIYGNTEKVAKAIGGGLSPMEVIGRIILHDSCAIIARLSKMCYN